jgi:hypothetical protein
MKLFDMVYFEADPGDVLFFHGNTLHASAPNTSDKPRWSLICCYNTKHNNPYKKHHHPFYTPLKKVEDDMIKKVGAKGSSAEQQSWMRGEDDKTTVGADPDAPNALKFSSKA